MTKTKLTFQNPSVNGRDYRAKGVHLPVPGQGELTKAVPADMVKKIKADFKRTAPYIRITEGETETPVPKETPEPPKEETEEIQLKAKSKSKKRGGKVKKDEPSKAKSADISDVAVNFIEEVKEQ